MILTSQSCSVTVATGTVHEPPLKGPLFLRLIAPRDLHENFVLLRPNIDLQRTRRVDSTLFTPLLIEYGTHQKFVELSRWSTAVHESSEWFFPLRGIGTSSSLYGEFPYVDRQTDRSPGPFSVSGIKLLTHTSGSNGEGLDSRGVVDPLYTRADTQGSFVIQVPVASGTGSTEALGSPGRGVRRRARYARSYF